MTTIRDCAEGMTPHLEVLMGLASEYERHPARIALAEIAGRQQAILDALDNAPRYSDIVFYGTTGELFGNEPIRARLIPDPDPAVVLDARNEEGV